MARLIPGTVMEYKNDDSFQVFQSLIEVTGGLSLSQVCTITGLQPSTIQNWVKRGFAPRPINKKYFERHIARILLISTLRQSINIEEIDVMMKSINGDVDDSSDDTISESVLYDYLVKAISAMDQIELNDGYIDSTVSTILSGETNNVEKVTYALKTMVYAYIAGHSLMKVKDNLELLKGTVKEG